MDPKEALKQSYLVRGLSYQEIITLQSAVEPRTYGDGDTLLRCQEVSQDLYVICEGLVRIITPSGNKIADLGPGRVVGEISLMDNAPRSATAVSVGPTTVAFISGRELQKLMSDYPNIELTLLRNVGKVLCEHIRRNNLELEKYYTLINA